MTTCISSNPRQTLLLFLDLRLMVRILWILYLKDLVMISNLSLIPFIVVILRFPLSSFMRNSLTERTRFSRLFRLYNMIPSRLIKSVTITRKTGVHQIKPMPLAPTTTAIEPHDLIWASVKRLACKETLLRIFPSSVLSPNQKHHLWCLKLPQTFLHERTTPWCHMEMLWHSWWIVWCILSHHLWSCKSFNAQSLQWR